ncbi:hypothetical protein IHE45_02G017400 [Dioscorea alata]|uniref:Uncharacterized protein n=1 Tax=Dioscorea alata TaxID=55571 RepID=A0ACB7WP66_DIOAL|nr:hypothetical protein IHE45_02G017400 [Dioscorea alata]
MACNKAFIIIASILLLLFTNSFLCPVSATSYFIGTPVIGTPGRGRIPLYPNRGRRGCPHGHACIPEYPPAPSSPCRVGEKCGHV